MGRAGQDGGHDDADDHEGHDRGNVGGREARRTPWCPAGRRLHPYRLMGTARNVTVTWPWPGRQPPPVTSRRRTGGGVKAGE